MKWFQKNAQQDQNNQATVKQQSSKFLNYIYISFFEANHLKRFISIS